MGSQHLQRGRNNLPVHVMRESSSRTHSAREVRGGKHSWKGSPGTGSSECVCADGKEVARPLERLPDKKTEEKLGATSYATHGGNT